MSKAPIIQSLLTDENGRPALCHATRTMIDPIIDCCNILFAQKFRYMYVDSGN